MVFSFVSGRMGTHCTVREDHERVRVGFYVCVVDPSIRRHHRSVDVIRMTRARTTMSPSLAPMRRANASINPRRFMPSRLARSSATSTTLRAVESTTRESTREDDEDDTARDDDRASRPDAGGEAPAPTSPRPHNSSSARQHRRLRSPLAPLAPISPRLAPPIAPRAASTSPALRSSSRRSRVVSTRARAPPPPRPPPRTRTPAPSSPYRAANASIHARSYRFVSDPPRGARTTRRSPRTSSSARSP